MRIAVAELAFTQREAPGYAVERSVSSRPSPSHARWATPSCAWSAALVFSAGR